MDKQESLQDKFGELYTKITSIPKRLADAVEEGLKEGLGQPSNLVSSVVGRMAQCQEDKRHCLSDSS